VSEACDHLKALHAALRGLLDILRQIAYRDPDFDLAQSYHRHRSQVEAHFLAALSCTYHPALRMALDVLDVLPLTLHEAARRVSWFRGGIGVVVPEHRDLLVIVPRAVELVMQAAVDLGCRLEPPPPGARGLSERQEEIIRLRHQGLLVKQIAEKLRVTERTVLREIASIRRTHPDLLPYRRTGRPAARRHPSR
jgi:hypothetical protein